MGSWAAHGFGNDEALDWLNDLIDEHDIYFIHNTLQIIAEFPAGDKPEPWDCECALAAAEMVAAAKGKPSEDLPEEARQWIDAYGFQADEEAIELAQKAIQRIERDSFLRDAWEDSGNGNQWFEALADLRARLAA